MSAKGRRPLKPGISIVIDEWTNSIIELSTGISFDTSFYRMSVKDIKQIVSKDWFFNWREEILLTDRFVYKMYADKNPKIIQGLISLTIEKGYVEVHKVENAKFNRGKKRIYKGSGGNLFAFACKISKENGFDGFIGFIAKTRLIPHYEKTLGAYVIRGQRMAIGPDKAKILINNYFK